jgi:hypothetical protein
MEIKKGNQYVCINEVIAVYGDKEIVRHKKGRIYQSEDDGYITDEQGNAHNYDFNKSQTAETYFRPATPDEVLIGRALTEEQQLLVKELKLKIELAKIEFMKCGLSEEQALAQVDLVMKNAIREVYHPKK